MSTILQIVLLLLDLAWLVILVHIVMSWLINFQVLNLRQPLVYQVWDGLNRLLDPIYSRVRRYLPDTGTLDLAPLVVLVAVYILRIIIVNNLYAFG